MTLSLIIQRAMSRHIREIAEWYNHELIGDTYFKNVEQCVTSSLSLVMVINLFDIIKRAFQPSDLVSGLLIE